MKPSVDFFHPLTVAILPSCKYGYNVVPSIQYNHDVRMFKNKSFTIYTTLRDAFMANCNNKTDS